MMPVDVSHLQGVTAPPAASGFVPVDLSAPLPAPPAPAPQPSLLQRVAGDALAFAKGFGKGAVSTFKNLAGTAEQSLTQNALGPIADVPQVAKPVSDALDTVKNAEFNALGIDNPSISTPSGTAQDLGFGAEKLAELAVPIGEGAKAASTVTDGASAALMNKVARINPSDAETFSHMSAGQTPGEWLDARGIYGSAENVVSQLFQRFNQSKTAVDDALAQLPGLYKPQAVQTALKDVVAHAEATSAEGAPSPYLTQAQDLLAKANADGLTMSDVNAAKRLYESTVKLNYIKDGVSAGIERANNIDSAIRTWQQDMASRLGFSNITQLNKETQLSKMLIDAIGKKQNAQIGNNLVGLTDWIVASHVPTDPSSLAMLLGKKVLSSTAAKGALAKLLSRGEKIATPAADIGPGTATPPSLRLPAPGETSQPTIELGSRTQSAVDASERANPQIKLPQ